MNPNKYYGTVSQWYDEKKFGYIQPDKGKSADLPAQNIILSADRLTAQYHTPKVGDKVVFFVETGEHNMLYATEIAPPPTVILRRGEQVEVQLLAWDLQQNGGYGALVGQEDAHVFTLGHFLKVFQVPEVGDILTGRLNQHANGQWLLEEIDIVPPPPPDTTKPFEQKTAVTQASQEPLPSAQVFTALPVAPVSEQSAMAAVIHEHKAPAPAFTPAPAKLAPAADTAVNSFVGAQAEQDLIQEITRELASDLDLEFDTAFSNVGDLPPVSLEFSAQTPVTLRGRIIQWDDEKGYGIIQNAQDEQTAFFHISTYHYQCRRPEIGELVSFYCEPFVPGAKPKAARVVRTEDELSLLLDDAPCDQRNMKLKSSKLLPYSVLACVYLAILAYFSFKLALLYALISAVTFFVYRKDKNIAQANRGRTDNAFQGRIPENTLHMLGMAGGWPGALVARIFFRHKTTKASFVQAFWVTVAVNIAFTCFILIYYADTLVITWLRN